MGHGVRSLITCADESLEGFHSLESSQLSTLMIETPGDLVRDLPCMQQASCLEGGPLLWIYLHVNQKSDDDDDWHSHLNHLICSCHTQFEQRKSV